METHKFFTKMIAGATPVLYSGTNLQKRTYIDTPCPEFVLLKEEPEAPADAEKKNLSTKER